MKKKPHKLFVDGASRGNPGPASVGCVIYDANDEEVFVISKRIGSTTNNQAEYSALVHGLEKALSEGISSLAVHADSELMVRQMLGQYKIKNEALKPLWKKAQDLSKEFKDFSIGHVRRELNSRADELANEALDSSEE